MSWSPKVILAANFYGSYLKPTLFDDIIIIQDGTIEQLVTAVQPRLESLSRVTNGEADVYVLCLVGLTDLVNKAIVGDKYVLKPADDVLPKLESAMHKAVRMWGNYGAKVIWSTTFPMSLAKYHYSQGWNIDNMQQFGFSKGMDMEQEQLFRMTERFMDLCHTLNRRASVLDLFFINKVYYSHNGRRELLTHNLLDDGINPTQSVTEDWNVEVSKYIRHIRQNRSSAASTSKRLDSNQPGFASAASDTLFTFGKRASQPAEKRLSEKRPGDELGDLYPKQARLENSILEKIESQSVDVQQDLAMNMLKMITNRLGRSSTSQNSASDHQNGLGQPSSGVFEQYPQPNRPAPPSGLRQPTRPFDSNVFPGNRVGQSHQRSSGRAKRSKRLRKRNRKADAPQTSGRANSSPTDLLKENPARGGIFGLAIEDRQETQAKTDSTNSFPESADRRHHNIPMVEPLLKDASAHFRAEPGHQRSYRDSTSKALLSDDYLLSSPSTNAPTERSRLVDSLDPRSKRHVELQYVVPGLEPRRPNHSAKPRQAFQTEVVDYTKAGDVPVSFTGIPYMIKSILVGDEKLPPKNCTWQRDDYIMMVTKPSRRTKNFCRLVADYNDQEGDKLGRLKPGARRFPIFNKNDCFGDRSIIPAVSFLVANQYVPGNERGEASMTVLQKEVATYNTALYNLMKKREDLVHKLKLSKDPSICMPSKPYISMAKKIKNLQKQIEGSGNGEKSELSEAIVLSDDDDEMAGGNEMESASMAKEKISEDEAKHDVVAKEDDWADLEEFEIEIGPNVAENEGPKTAVMKDEPNACGSERESSSCHIEQPEQSELESTAVDASYQDSKESELDAEVDVAKLSEPSKEDNGDIARNETNGPDLATQSSPSKSEVSTDAFLPDFMPSASSLDKISPTTNVDSEQTNSCLSNMEFNEESSTSEEKQTASDDATESERQTVSDDATESERQAASDDATESERQAASGDATESERQSSDVTQDDVKDTSPAPSPQASESATDVVLEVVSETKDVESGDNQLNLASKHEDA